MEMNFYAPFFTTLSLIILLGSPLQAEEAPWGPKIIKLGDVTISCEAYEKYYRDIVEDAAKNNSPKWNAAAKSRLDEAFGTYKTGWIRNSTYIIDKYGKKLPTHHPVKDIECVTKYKSGSYTTQGHGSGYNDWDQKGYHYTEKKHVTDKVRLGYVDDCKIMVTQDIWPELGKCGTGTIIRNFSIGVWCGNRDYTLKLTQKIHVVPSCSFSKKMLNIPDVQWMCAPIKYEDNNHVKLADYIKPVTLYGDWESSCHSSKVYVSYYDKVYTMIQEHRKYVVIRTWVFSDQCTGKKIEAEQKIMVDGLCRDDEPDKPDKPDKPDEPDPPANDTVQYKELLALDDIFISYESYQNTYQDVVELALENYRKGNVALSSELLNAVFGRYQIKADTVNIDSLTVYTMDCNDGNPIDTTFMLSNGVIQSDCPENLKITQKLREEYTECGAKGLLRQFIVESQCDTVVMTDTFTQRIVFSPTCALTADVFDVPVDTLLCGTLEKDENNRITLPVNDQPIYLGDSTRQFEVDYKFFVSYSSEDPYRTDVSRVWTFTDTCHEETTMLTQNLVLMDTCGAELAQGYSRAIVQTVAKENIEWGISDEVREKINSEEIQVSQSELNAYPNPFTHNLQLNLDLQQKGPVEIRVLNSQGAFLSRHHFDLEMGKQRIDLSGDIFNVSGMYILQVISGDRMDHIRVIYQSN